MTVAAPPTLSGLRAAVAARLAQAPCLEPVVRADAAREARWLVDAVLGRAPAAWRSADDDLTPEAVARVEAAAVRRAAGEPLAYCVGTAAFRHLELRVDPRVLIPRPETEGVVEEALACVVAHPGGVAVDVGTGSGAIALSLATEGAFARVIATDVSADALDVARANADGVARRTPAGRPMAPVEFRLGADYAPLAGVRARIIVSNPPYIAYDEAAALSSGVRDWEPPVALFAADGGMARYRALCAGAAAHLEPGGWLVLEVDARRAADTAALARGAGLTVERLVRDLAGRDRVLVARRAGHPGDATDSFTTP